MKILISTALTYLLLLSLVIFSGTALAQDSNRPMPAAEGAPGQAPGLGSNLAFEPVGIGDLLYVSVADSPEASRSYRVSASGTIPLALLPKPVSVDGQLPSEIESIIAREFVNSHVLAQPVVSVAVIEYRSRPVSVVGAGPEVVVTRPEQDPLRIPAKALIAGSDPALNFVLKGGEEIRVPEAGKFVIVGNVKNPGTYPANGLDRITSLGGSTASGLIIWRH